MVDQIILKRADGTVALELTENLPETRDAASVMAQKLMNLDREVVSAHIIGEDVERVVSRATAWQKMN